METTYRGMIIDFDYQGHGVTKLDNATVFLDGGMIGDQVEYIVTKKKRNFLKGRIIEILKPSSDRIPSPCPYSSTCGGCDFLEYPYEKELLWKQNLVKNNMKRIGEIEGDVQKIVPSTEIFHYRNHMQFQVKGKQVGLFSKNSRTITEIDTCLMQSPNGNKVLKIMKEWKKIHHLDRIGIRSNQKDEILLILVSKKSVPKLNSILPDLLEAGVISIYENINPSNRHHYSKNFHKIFGKDLLTEKLGSYSYRLSPQSFFQINRQMTEKLYQVALDQLDLDHQDLVYDLYSGIGTISLKAAQGAGKVIGIEIEEQAVENARDNAVRNGITNTRFIAGAAEEGIIQLKEQEDLTPNAVIVDPPRGGLDPSLVQFLTDHPVEKILYISCNPATQARDIKMWKGHYKVERIIPVDMFPRTAHVECVVLLSRE
ncbi:MAG: 23S rRNA (uracil(1939)-C(5))-methyltransferase RlmD [Tissierellia bacterium]|nr:23S rRNA (uracil(1939)-C(5))-methyltransferase RlmD [Tissierellia bacterium]